MTLTARQRFLAACRCQPVDRPPVWLMRQAGRALPEYRALRLKHSFLELVQTPDLAAEVTLQPVRRFGFDAAILFSDILVVPEAMGQPYRFREAGGVELDFPLRGPADIARLSAVGVAERLGYMDRALRRLRAQLGDQTALIGFAGSPWTLATFMVEGGSARPMTRALEMFRHDRRTYFSLAEKLTTAVAACLKLQIAAGVDAVQIFDSHGGLLPAAEFEEASGRWMREVVSRLAPRAVPVIVFSPGTHDNWADLLATGANVLGIDWQFPLVQAREVVPEGVALQGNVAPALLREATPDAVRRETQAVLESMRGRAGHILNLGGGVPPDAKLENIAALVDTARGFK